MSPGAHACQHCLGLQGGQVTFCLAGDQFGQQPLEPVDGLDPATGERFATIGEHPQHLELPVDLQDPQGRGADPDDCDGVHVQCVGLAVVTGVEEPDPGGELGRHVHNVFTSLE